MCGLIDVLAPDVEGNEPPATTGIEVVRMWTADQARFFARNGYVQLPGIVDAATCAHLVERTWKVLPAHWRRDDPTSWRGEVTDSCHTVHLDRGGLLKFQLRDLADDPYVQRAFLPSSPVHELARSLIGRPLLRYRKRGLYAVAPAEHPERLARAPSPHVEAHPAQIVMVCYLDDVAPGGGGLMVWPGSHRDLWHGFVSKLDHAAAPDLEERMARWRSLAPIELPGGRGDVIFTHHRLLHSPSVNTSRRIRFAFLCDFLAADHEALSRQSPGPDLWSDWPGLKALAEERGLDDGPDFALPPAKPVRRRFWWRSAPRRDCSRNKSEASHLARQRQPGAVWLVLSDSPGDFARCDTLDPVGGNLTARGIAVRCNGAPLASRSGGGFTVQLAPRPGRNEVEITGIDGPLW
ncbi:MAG: phytanoyl-CoA dioxygenase family protein, partial [Planctomycetes bacterium]|nr:phytanoyl-CoA dioxygenase family protein [Planctomycetota bacterium]